MLREDEHNKKILENTFYPAIRGTGVTCQNCETELVYSDNMILTSNPAQARAHCPNCGRHTTIYI